MTYVSGKVAEGFAGEEAPLPTESKQPPYYIPGLERRPCDHSGRPDELLGGSSVSPLSQGTASSTETEVPVVSPHGGASVFFDKVTR